MGNVLILSASTKHAHTMNGSLDFRTEKPHEEPISGHRLRYLLLYVFVWCYRERYKMCIKLEAKKFHSEVRTHTRWWYCDKVKFSIHFLFIYLFRFSFCKLISILRTSTQIFCYHRQHFFNGTYFLIFFEKLNHTVQHLQKAPQYFFA